MQPDKTPEDLAIYRLQRARECLQDAKRLIVDDSYNFSANRSYYSIFHAMRAIQALDKFDSKKHSGVIANFRQNYIKTGIFPAKFSDIVGSAFVIRNDSDYEDFYIISKEKVIAQIENAKLFLSAVEEYINTKLPPESA